MGPITRLFTNVRYKLMGFRITWEIYHRIFFHLDQTHDYGYPFTSDAELDQHQRTGTHQTVQLIKDIDEAGGQMPEAEGNAFRYIVARDLHVQLRRYLKYARARKSLQISTGVATRLTPEMNN